MCTVYQNSSFIVLCKHVFGSIVPHMQIEDCEDEAFLVVSISKCCVLGCDVVWFNFPGHNNLLPELFLYLYFSFNRCVDQVICNVLFTSSYCVDA
jgi:hypothetical protein